MQILVKFEGLRGSKTNGKDPGWFEFERYALGPRRAGSTGTGEFQSAGGSPNDVVLGGSTYLLELARKCASGEAVGKVLMDVSTPKHGRARYTLGGVFVTGFRTSGQDDPVYSYTLSFREFRADFYPPK